MRRGSRTSQRCTKAALAMALCTSASRAQDASETVASTAAPFATIAPRDGALESTVTAAATATEQQPGLAAGDVDAARSAFWEGHRRFEAAEYSAALELFEKSYALLPQPELVFNIALTHEHLGNCAAALATYERYLASDGSRAANESDRQRAAHHRDELATRCHVASDPQASQEAVVLTGTLSVAPTPAPNEPPPPMPSTLLSDRGEVDASNSNLRSQLGWATLGAAALSLGAVVYLDVRRRAARGEHADAKREYEAKLTASAGDDVDEAAADFYRTRDLEIAMAVVSGVLAATGSALLLYHPSPGRNEASAGISPELALGMRWVGAF